MLEEFREIQAKLESVTANDKEEVYIDLIGLIIKVSDYVCGSGKVMKDGVRDIMNGRVLPLMSDKLKEKGRAEGRAEGILDGKVEVFLNMLKSGMNRQEAQSLADISDEYVEIALKQFENESNSVE